MALVTGIILAGGKSTRLGRDKAKERVGGQTLLERAVAALAQVAEEVIIVVASDQERGVPRGPRVRVAEDVHPGRGPVGGLHAGLLACRSPHAWAVACDMPFLNPRLLRSLMALAPGYDAVVPRTGGRDHTLHAVYGRGCLDTLEGLLAQEQEHPGILDLLARVRVRYVQEAEVRLLDPEGLSLFNINSPQDLERARALVERENP
ncbi:MAG: molybdenum cofactor guanylyltransferase [Chloroflexi bacterium]|nr:molybdenum cofactor guanylyltransferase [Chloroflexota bacterium]